MTGLKRFNQKLYKFVHYIAEMYRGCGQCPPMAYVCDVLNSYCNSFKNFYKENL